jgi:2-amino-4-hydroxy-6-hydroxymethyldihydropteridine diphosphokinase
MKIAFLGIGTNLGDREANLKQAITSIEEYIGTILKSSSVYETEPWGFITEDKFLNVVVKIETDLAPARIMSHIVMIESLMGRVRTEQGYSSRVIDIDILLYDDSVTNEVNLKIPHPLLQERKFVLIPLCEIAPNMIHPVLKKSFTQLLEFCNDRSDVKKYW